MKKSIAISLGLIFLFSLSACAQADEQVPTVQPTVEQPTPTPEAPPCADVSGVWMGTRTTEIVPGTKMDNDWGLVLEQDGCQVSGHYALNPDAKVSCEFEDDMLMCENQTEDCFNYTALVILPGELLGASVNSCLLDLPPDDVDLFPSNEQSVADANQAVLDSLSSDDEDLAVGVCQFGSTIREDWALGFCDQFDDNNNAWQLGASSDNLIDFNTDIQNGKLMIKATGKATSGFQNGVLHWFEPFDYKDDYMVEMTGTIDSVFKGAAWGFGFETDLYSDKPPSFYSFLITNVGQYTILKLENNKLTTVLSPRSNSAIKLDAENTITIVNEGSVYEFYANGELLTSQELNEMPGTDLMLTVYVDEGAAALFEMDNLSVRWP